MKKVEVEFEGKKYVFYLRYITYGERKRILKKTMNKDGFDYAEAEHWLLAYSIEKVEPEDILDVGLKKDINKFYKAIEELPDPIAVIVAREAVLMNPLMA